MKEQDQEDPETLTKEQVLKIRRAIKASGIIEQLYSQIPDSVFSDMTKQAPTLTKVLDELIDYKPYNDAMVNMHEAMGQMLNENVLKVAKYQTELFLFEDKTDSFFDEGWYPLSNIVHKKFDDSKTTIDEFMIISLQDYLKGQERSVLFKNQYIKEAILAYESGHYLASLLTSFAAIENIIGHMFAEIDNRDKNKFKRGKGKTTEDINSEAFANAIMGTIVNLPNNLQNIIIANFKSYFNKNRNDVSHGKYITPHPLSMNDLSATKTFITQKDAAVGLNSLLLVFFVAQTGQDIITIVRQPSRMLEDIQLSLANINITLEDEQLEAVEVDNVVTETILEEYEKAEKIAKIEKQETRSKENIQEEENNDKP